jgi:hypothetical protein
MGDFKGVHILPPSSGDVPEDLNARLVVLGIEQTYSKEEGNAAEKAAKMILETRGSSPRLYRNTLVFLAADKTRFQDLDEAIRKYLAWESILGEKDKLDLSPHQVKQAVAQKESANSTVNARVPETYQWLLVPVQKNPKSPVEIQAFKLSGQESLAARASKKLKNDQLLTPALVGTNLRIELDKIPLWRGNHVEIKQLAEDFASYPYLYRLTGPAVLTDSINSGLRILTWEEESFAYADSFDEAKCRYRGLCCGQQVKLSEDTLQGLLVKPDIAASQTKAEVPSKPETEIEITTPPETIGGHTKVKVGGNKTMPPQKQPPKRFYGSVTLDPTRVGRDASQIAEEVISHLSGLVGSTVKVTLEIDADIPSGVPDHVVRIVLENGKTLKFTSQGFEEE